MANVINATSTGNGGLVSTGDDSGILNIQTNETTAITVDASQKVGIGTTSPSYRLHVVYPTTDNAIVLDNGGGAGDANAPYLAFSGTNNGASYVRGRIRGAFPTITGGGLVFDTGSSGSMSEAMRIDTSGNLLVGTTSTVAGERFNVTAGSTTGILVKNTGGADSAPIYYWNATTTGNGYFAAFFTETSASFRGSITYNRAAGLISYNTTSDYRAKTVNGLVQNALSKVVLLKPSTGRMNGATEDIDFFVAHELQQVVPSAVIGEKDAVNEDNTPKYQVVDKSALIPLLTAALQETKALIDTQAETINALTARIVALEGQ